MVRRNAWLTPDTGTGEAISRCLTFPRSMLPHVTGALSALTEVWRWEQYGDMSPDSAAQFATVMLDQFVSECGVNMQVRQNELNPCSLEFSNDQGESWFEFANLALCQPVVPETVEYPDDMRLEPVTGDLQYSLDGTTWYDYPEPATGEPTQPYTPPRAVPAGASNYQKRCAAASSAANALGQMYEQTYGAIAAGIANTWGAFSNFMNDVTDFVFGITYGQYWDIAKLIGLWQEIDFETNYAAATLTGQQLQDLTCLIFDNTTIDADGHSQVNFGAVVDNVIAELGINPGTAVWTHLNYIQSSGLERIADVGFGDVDCGCSEIWCVAWDFTQGAQGWETVSATGRGGELSSDGWHEECEFGSANTWYSIVRLRLTLPFPVTFTKLVAEYDQTLGTPPNPDGSGWTTPSGAGVPSGNYTAQQIIWENELGGVVPEFIQFRISSHRSATEGHCNTGDSRVYRVYAEGFGDKPDDWTEVECPT